MPKGRKGKRVLRRVANAVRASTTAKALKAARDTHIVDDSTAIDLPAVCQATKADMAALERIIAGGKDARNAASSLKALELKWAYGHGRPKLAVEHSGKIGLDVLLAAIESESD